MFHQLTTLLVPRSRCAARVVSSAHCKPRVLQSSKEISNETERYVNHRVSPLDPLHDVSPGGRHRPRNGARNAFKPHCAAHSRRLDVRNVSWFSLKWRSDVLR